MIAVKKAVYILLSILVASCIATPIPVEQKTLEGRRYTDSDLQFVQTGATASNEIRRHLGQPTIRLRAQRILVYGLREVAGTGWVWLLASPGGTGAGGIIETENKEAIFFVLNDQEILTNWGRMPVKRGQTWLGAALEWSQALGVKTPQPRQAFYEVFPTGPEQSLVYFYRPRDYQHYLPVVAPAERLLSGVADFVNIYLDGELVGQLRWKSYLVVSVAPGEHAFSISPDTDDVVNPQLYRSASLGLSIEPQTTRFIEVGVEAGKGIVEPRLIERSHEQAIDVIGALRESW